MLRVAVGGYHQLNVGHIMISQIRHDGRSSPGQPSVDQSIIAVGEMKPVGAPLTDVDELDGEWLLSGCGQQ